VTLRGFVGALVFLVLIAGLAAALVFGTGAWDVAASRKRPGFDRLADWTKVHSVQRHARSLTLPPAGADAIAEGMEHYAENCLPCHGAPGVRPAEFHEGMNPEPPHVDSQTMQRWSDAELFWITKQGIAMTGMPAFGGNHDDTDIRNIVAFVRHAPQLTAAEKAELAEHAPKDEHHHHGDEEAAPASTPGPPAGASAAPDSAPPHTHPPGTPPHHHHH
jgi:mono/diheme cytochrome c family protein